MRQEFCPVGIIDIGSNSVRFVAMAAQRECLRICSTKVTAALAGDRKRRQARRREFGQGACRDRPILSTWTRYEAADASPVCARRGREASNGAAFLKEVAAVGLKPRILPGEEEAELSGMGVLSGTPDARGVVADLGGGSLELIQIGDGKLGTGLSLPLGVLRVGNPPSRRKIVAAIRKGVEGTELDRSLAKSSLHLVGGSFRALARLDLHERGPLPIFSPTNGPGTGAALERGLPHAATDLKERSGSTETAVTARGDRDPRCCELGLGGGVPFGLREARFTVTRHCDARQDRSLRGAEVGSGGRFAIMARP